MTAVRRSKVPRPAGTDGESKRDDHENTLPLVGRVSGHVRLYEERGEGGGRRETGTTRTEREIEQSSRQARYLGGDWQRDEGLTTIAAAPSPAGTARIEREIERQAGTLPGRRMTTRQETRDSRPLQGAPSPKPLHQHPSQVPPATQVREEHAHNHHRDTWKGQQEQHGTGRQSVWADGG